MKCQFCNTELEDDALFCHECGAKTGESPAEEPGEEILKEWILQAQEQMPKELGRYLLEKTLQYADYRAKDDMTVLVAGIWRK